MSVAAPPQIYKGHDEGSYFLNVPVFPGRKCPVWISFEDWESRDCECKNIKIIITQYLSSIYSMHGKFSETQRANNSNNCDLFFRALLAASSHLLLLRLLQHYQLRQQEQQRQKQLRVQSHLQQWPKPEHRWPGNIAIWIIKLNAAMFPHLDDLLRHLIRDMGVLQHLIRHILGIAELRTIGEMSEDRLRTGNN